MRDRQPHGWRQHNHELARGVNIEQSDVSGHIAGHIYMDTLTFEVIGERYELPQTEQPSPCTQSEALCIDGLAALRPRKQSALV